MQKKCKKKSIISNNLIKKLNIKQTWTLTCDVIGSQNMKRETCLNF